MNIDMKKETDKLFDYHLKRSLKEKQKPTLTEWLGNEIDKQKNWTLFSEVETLQSIKDKIKSGEFSGL